EPEAAFGEGITLERVRGVGDRRLDARAELAELGRQRPAACLQLEQECLRRLAREPQLAAVRVVAETFRRHSGDLRRKQLVLRNDGHLGDKLCRVAADEDRETPEPSLSRSLEQRERSGGVVANDG